jgi:hypothetical protein
MCGGSRRAERGCTVSAPRKGRDTWAARNAAMERRIQHDTCGLGQWRQPADWCTEPFSHTVTTVCDVIGQQGGWHLYNSGVVVTLAVQPIEGPFVRGVPYVWCKAAHDRRQQRRLSHGADLRAVPVADEARPGGACRPGKGRSPGRRVRLLLPRQWHDRPRCRSIHPLGNPRSRPNSPRLNTGAFPYAQYPPTPRAAGRDRLALSLLRIADADPRSAAQPRPYQAEIEGLQPRR